MRQPKNETSNVRIRISGLSQGVHEYHFSSKPEELGLDENFKELVETDARLEKTPRQLYLKVESRTAGHFPCDRCLDEFSRAVTAEYSMFYLYDESDSGDRLPEEVQYITPETPYINLAEDIRQMISLSVPLKLLCADTCKGLCPHCGVNLNRKTCDCTEDIGDRRFSSLKSLLNR
jgi:uncharacterized protein